jgi:PRTRC genetic system protein E
MQSNFFQQLNNFHPDAEWKFTIKASAQNYMLVTVQLTSDKTGDTAKELIPPLLLKGSSENFDKNFFEELKVPVQKTMQLLQNMAEYEKGLENAQKESKMDKSKKDRDKKESDNKEKQYDNIMKKVKELEQAGKYREAYGQLPKVDDYEDHTEDIEEKKKELSAKFEQPELFNP